MGGGLMQIVAYGSQDDYLTGDPTYRSSLWAMDGYMGRVNTRL